MQLMRRIDSSLPAMYNSLKLAWSEPASPPEVAYRDAGLVKTKGSLFLLPPSLETLKNAFNTPSRPKSTLSAGAKALCKHFERGGASSEHGRHHPFWTLPRGNNENKNLMAGRILEAMLADAKWKNVMLLHHGVAVYEVRNSRGYGMRWTLNLREDQSSKETESQESPESMSTQRDDSTGTYDTIEQTTFRGFLEPIEGLDNELPYNDGT